jgi:hypothetical protein
MTDKWDAYVRKTDDSQSDPFYLDSVPAVEDKWSKYTRQPKDTQKGQEVSTGQEPFLPKHAQTEKKITSREDAMQRFLEEAAYMPKNKREWAFKPLMFGLKGIDAIRQRGEGAMANVGMQAQEGGRIPPIAGNLAFEAFRATLDPNVRQDYADKFKAFTQGLTGERKGEFGDIPRKALPEMKVMGYDVSEPIASFIGMGTLMGVYQLASGMKAAKTLDDRLPKSMTDDWLVQRSKNLSKIADTGKQVADDMAKKIYTSSIGKIKADKYSNDITNTLKLLKSEDVPKAIIKEIMLSLGTDSQANISNLHKITSILAKHTTKSGWANNSSTAQAYKSLKKIIMDAAKNHSENAFNVIESFDNFAKPVYREAEVIKRMVTDSTGVARKTSALVSTFKSKGKAGVRKLLKDFGSRAKTIEKPMKQLMKDMGKYVKRQKTKEFIQGAAPTAALLSGGGYGAYRLTGVLGDLFGE